MNKCFIGLIEHQKETEENVNAKYSHDHNRRIILTQKLTVDYCKISIDMVSTPKKQTVCRGTTYFYSPPHILKTLEKMNVC